MKNQSISVFRFDRKIQQFIIFSIDILIDFTFKIPISNYTFTIYSMKDATLQSYRKELATHVGSR